MTTATTATPSAAAESASTETDTNPSSSWIIKFVPFASAVASPFWVEYNREKLETWKLSTAAVPIQAHYSSSSSTSSGTSTSTGTCRLSLEEDGLRRVDANNQSNDDDDNKDASLQAPQQSQQSRLLAFPRVTLQGSLRSFNTVQDFSQQDKNVLLREALIPHIIMLPNTSSTAANNNTTILQHLTQFVLLTFSDLKSHQVLYWFGIPTLSPLESRDALRATQPAQGLVQTWDAPRRQALDAGLQTMMITMQPRTDFPAYFVISNNNDNTSCVPLADFDASTTLTKDVIFGFLDPLGGGSTSTSDADTQHPRMGWPLRNLIAYLSLHVLYPNSDSDDNHTVQVLSYRPRRCQDAGWCCDDSILLEVKVPTPAQYGYNPSDATSTTTDTAHYKVVGWEMNARGKPGPRSVNLAPLLDHRHLAIQAANLNLQLMKWRMIPDLNVNKLQNLRVLLLGAGTLGCNVARTLLGWGVRNMTLVDYGKVSYSNPVRQPLFGLDDCKNGGRPKAQAAAEALSRIAADVQAQGVTLSIPMPGHPEDRTALAASVQQLDALIQSHDAVFLLTDTRESRWLPTVMARAHDKPLINAALGLDSWLVMRHGHGDATNITAQSQQQQPTAQRYGCYFCNDVVAPENSTKNRTLDQQCTVTRPGLAPIASSMAVELLVALLHHPDGLASPAPATSSKTFAPGGGSSSSSNINSPLGVIPHQIRGSLTSYTVMTPTVPAFGHCTGCSAPIVQAYREDPVELCWKASQSVDGSCLEAISGLEQFRAAAQTQMEELWEDENLDGDDF